MGGKEMLVEGDTFETDFGEKVKPRLIKQNIFGVPKRIDMYIPCVRWNTQEKDTRVTQNLTHEHCKDLGEGEMHTQTLLNICR